MSKTNVIPDFSEDLPGVATATRSLKMAVEDLTGQRQGRARAPRMYTQLRAPDPRAGIELETGDLWINTATHKMSYWTGRVWQALVV